VQLAPKPIRDRRRRGHNRIVQRRWLGMSVHRVHRGNYAGMRRVRAGRADQEQRARTRFDEPVHGLLEQQTLGRTLAKGLNDQQCRLTAQNFAHDTFIRTVVPLHSRPDTQSWCTQFLNQGPQLLAPLLDVLVNVFLDTPWAQTGRRENVRVEGAIEQLELRSQGRSQVRRFTQGTAADAIGRSNRE